MLSRSFLVVHSYAWVIPALGTVICLSTLPEIYVVKMRYKQLLSSFYGWSSGFESTSTSLICIYLSVKVVYGHTTLTMPVLVVCIRVNEGWLVTILSEESHFAPETLYTVYDSKYPASRHVINKLQGFSIWN